jgi:hypothetical protein
MIFRKYFPALKLQFDFVKRFACYVQIKSDILEMLMSKEL